MDCPFLPELVVRISHVAAVPLSGPQPETVDSTEMRVVELCPALSDIHPAGATVICVPKHQPIPQNQGAVATQDAMLKAPTTRHFRFSIVLLNAKGM